jgi:RHS repeat-associated protein
MMGRRMLRARVARRLGMVFRTALLALAAALVSQPASAQLTSGGAPPPVIESLDERGINLVSGQNSLQLGYVSIGAVGAGELNYKFPGGSDKGPLGYVYSNDGVKYNVSFGPSSDTFTLSGTLASGSFTQDQGRNASLVYSSAEDKFTYTRTDGSVATYSVRNSGAMYGISSLVRPDGEILTYAYKHVTYDCGTTCPLLAARSITNNFGYQLRFEYASEDPASADARKLVKIVGLNLAVEYCAPDATTCALTNNWPYLAISPDGLTITDAAQRVTTLAAVTNLQFTLTRPGRGPVTYTRNAQGKIISVSDGVGAWNYQYDVPCPVCVSTTVTDPFATARRYNALLPWGRIVEMIVDSTITTTNFPDDVTGRLTGVSLPEGNRVDYAFDDRGNIKTTTLKPKSSTGPFIVSRTVYPESCTDPGISIRNCNKPLATIDERQNQTDYVYSSVHGGLLSMTMPAKPNGVRPQIRYEYEPVYAAYKTSANGAPAPASTPIYRLVRTSVCATGQAPACIGTADETRTSVSYAGSNNLNPTAITVSAGDQSLSSTTSRTYDANGDLVTVDGPLAGAGDLVTFRYDALRRRVGTVGSAIVDHNNVTRRPASRVVYHADGQVLSLDQGYFAANWNGDWTSFTPTVQQQYAYDNRGGRIRSSKVADGVVHELLQYSYDAGGRVDCVTQRLNPGTFSALPASACTAGAAGPDGPDRITKFGYDKFGQRTSASYGYGVSGQVPVVEGATYTVNGKVQTITDARGGKTTYTYDGYDRLAKTRYPSPSGGDSSTTDYVEILNYDDASNIVQMRLRDGSIVNNQYDALNRASYRDGPKGWYEYDNFGRPTLLKSGDLGERQSAQAYDALGRPTVSSDLRNGAWRATTSRFDIAGRRTRVTWNDGFYVDYGYNDLGWLESVTDSGGQSLATYVHDVEGRVRQIARGDGGSSTYAYDAGPQPSGLTLDLPGSIWDQTYGFTYNAAGQLKEELRTNDRYSPVPAAMSRADTFNGLNQVQTMGSSAVRHNPRGDLSCDAFDTGSNACVGSSYAYDLDEQLLSKTTGALSANLSYDPLGRLSTINTDTRLEYDGYDLITEYDASGAILRRYVHGAGRDEPLVWYEGAGLGDRRWLVPDRLGSIVAVSSTVGGGLNTYDSYGVPGAANRGRFQYTGQTWIPETGLYYYKARIYSPTLGRFVQPDPIGYQAGLNLYGYVGGDPVNMTDPSGQCPFCVVAACAVSPMCRAAVVGISTAVVTTTYEVVIKKKPFDEALMDGTADGTIAAIGTVSPVAAARLVPAAELAKSLVSKCKNFDCQAKEVLSDAAINTAWSWGGKAVTDKFDPKWLGGPSEFFISQHGRDISDNFFDWMAHNGMRYDPRSESFASFWASRPWCVTIGEATYTERDGSTHSLPGGAGQSFGC